MIRKGNIMKRIRRVTQGKTFFENRRDLIEKGVKSKPINKDKFFGKGKKK